MAKSPSLVQNEFFGRNPSTLSAGFFPNINASSNIAYLSELTPFLSAGASNGFPGLTPTDRVVLQGILSTFIDDLADVNNYTYYYYNSSTADFSSLSTGTAINSINDLPDVNLAGLTNGQTLTYDLANNEFVNSDLDATTIPVTPSGNLTATDLEAALLELQGDIDAINAAANVISVTGTLVDNTDTSNPVIDYQTAADTSITTITGLTATDVQAALVELATSTSGLQFFEQGTAPATANPGDTWWDTSGDVLRTFIDNGGNPIWVSS